MGLSWLAWVWFTYRREVTKNPKIIVLAVLGPGLMLAFAVYVGRDSIGFRRMRVTLMALGGETGHEVRGSGLESRTAIWSL